MIPLKASLTISEVVADNADGTKNSSFPHDGRCKSGHEVPPGTRFFVVSGVALSKARWGIYCEPCLIVANKLVRDRQAARADGSPDSPTEKE